MVHMGFILLVGLQLSLILVLHQLQSVELGKVVLSLHRQCGVVILILVAVRLLVGLRHRPPASPANSPAWQSAAARAVHLALLAILIAQPMLGILETWSRGDHIVLLGLIALPTLVQLTTEQGKPFALAHQLLAYGLISVIAVHLGAIGFNRIVRKTQVTERMLPAPRLDRLINRVPIQVQLALVCGAILALSTASGIYSAHQYKALNDLRAGLAQTTTGPLDDLRAAQLDLKSLAVALAPGAAAETLNKGARAVAAELAAVAPKLTDADAAAGTLKAGHALGTLLATRSPQAFAEADTQLQNAVDSQSMAAFQKNAELDAVAAKGHDLIVLALAPTIAIAAVLAFLLSRSLVAALGQARAVLLSIATGSETAAVQVVGRGEFASLMREIFDMRAAIQAREQASAEQQLRDLAEVERRQREEAASATARRHAAEETAVVTGVAEGLHALAMGELGFRLLEAFPDGYEPLRQDFNRVMAELEVALSTIAVTSRTLDGTALGVAKAVSDLSQRTERQAIGIQQTAQAISEVTQAVANSADDLGEASRVVTVAQGEAEASTVIVNEAVAAMRRIETSSNQISKIVGLIDEIAFQTNLLALNAGVEAARAGEQGKGFAVVAQEVRALSQRTATAAKEIKSLIEESGENIGAGVALVGRTGEALERIREEVGEIHGVVTSIAVSGRIQAQSLKDVNVAVGQIQRITEQNGAMAIESTRSVGALTLGVYTLDQQIGKFNVSGAPPARRRAA
jgi:methyl-accepting chemotaxis protein